MPHVLIVDDDKDSTAALAHIVVREGFTAGMSHCLADARERIAERRPDVVLLDLVLPDGKGMDLFADLPSPRLMEVILITGHASIETSIEALRLGAADYLTKPINVQRLRQILSRIARPSDLKAEIDQLRGNLRELGRFGRLLGVSGPMQKIYDQLTRVSPTIASVLLIGESGTGKEAVAQTIHEISSRKKQLFLAVNCSAISPQLIESELFGHEKGSFTGATRDRKGYFEQANGGTLFLDEITEMPVEMQVKLLRVLETGSLIPVGSNVMVETDVRIVAATNRIPKEAVAEVKIAGGVILLYRLPVFPIYLPPLRNRLDDVGVLAEHFLEELNQSEGTKKILTDEAKAALKNYSWPGNVRELRNAVHRAFIMTDQYLDSDSFNGTSEDSPNHSSKRNGDLITVGMTFKEVEEKLMLKTLHHCGYNREKAAEMLGISVKTLFNRLKTSNDDDRDSLQK